MLYKLLSTPRSDKIKTILIVKIIILNPIKKTILYNQNAIYCGYEIEKLMEKAGAGIARELVKKYGLGKRIAFICGPGNNGGDGFAAARSLKGKADIKVYLVTKSNKIKTPESKKNWNILKSEKKYRTERYS